MTRVEALCGLAGIGFLLHATYRVSPIAAEFVWALLLIIAAAPARKKGD